MATKTPLMTEAKHAVMHFLFIYCVIQFGKVWFPTHNFFRTLWWKAWGHNPKDNVGFHLDQIQFDDAYFDRMAIAVAIMNLAKAFYGEGRENKSYAYLTFMMFSQHSYLKYAEYMSIYEMYNLKHPGQYILDWFCRLDGINPTAIEHRCTFDAHFSAAVIEVRFIELKAVSEK